MHANWQAPYPVDELKFTDFAPSGASVSANERNASDTLRRAGARDRFDYWLIFAVCLVVFVWVGVIERCNPLHWLARRGSRAETLWTQARRSAHHCTKLALQG